MSDTRAVYRVCAFLCAVNLALFGVKLYIGLATNSISIFSDAVNNLFDALSALLTFAVLRFMLRASDANTVSMLNKGEQLFSFLISGVIVFTGLYFAYSALERFLYPTPVWYTETYFALLSVTALVKLGLCVWLRAAARRLASPVLRLICFDSLLDFLIGCFTLLTLLLSGTANFSFDALFGLAISAAITVPAVRMLLRSGAELISFVPAGTRRRVNELLEAQDRPFAVRYLRFGNKTEAYAFFRSLPADPAALAERVKAQTDIDLYCIEEAPHESNQSQP